VAIIEKKLLVRAAKKDRKQNIKVPSVTCWKIPHKTVNIFAMDVLMKFSGHLRSRFQTENKTYQGQTV
jgi:hypothetical protein